MFKGGKVIGNISENRIGKHKHRLDSINMMWEYDRAFLKGRKDLACHPIGLKQISGGGSGSAEGQDLVNKLGGKDGGPQRYRRISTVFCILLQISLSVLRDEEICKWAGCTR